MWKMTESGKRGRIHTIPKRVLESVIGMPRAALEEKFICTSP